MPKPSIVWELSRVTASKAASWTDGSLFLDEMSHTVTGLTKTDVRLTDVRFQLSVLQADEWMITTKQLYSIRTETWTFLTKHVSNPVMNDPSSDKIKRCSLNTSQVWAHATQHAMCVYWWGGGLVLTEADV